MKWFQGSVTEAVTASKLKEAVFVVFVEGQDDISQKIAQNLNSVEVSSRLETEKFVAIKLESNSENYKLFAQIYQSVSIPSIFFIGKTGTPLEIIRQPLSPSELASKIDSILLKVYPQAAHSSANLINAEQKEHSFSSDQETINSESIVSNIDINPRTSNFNQTAKDFHSDTTMTSNLVTEPVENNAADISQEEKLKRAKMLIEIQNKKKEEEEKQKQREREIERRKTGKDVQKLRQILQDQEIKEAYEERLKEKAAEASARERVLKQIAEDKLERKKKNEIHMQEKAAQEAKAKEELQARTQAAKARDLTTARIQFKLPVGNSISSTFEATDTLGHLRTYVTQNAQLPYKQFSMSSFFPRKDFTSVDDNKTLLELELVPSAVVIILPLKSGNPASVIKSTDGAGIISYYFWTLLAPVVSIYHYIMGYFRGRPRGGETSNSNERTSSENTQGENTNIGFGRMSNMGMRISGQGTSKIRSRGNIHTLHSGDNKDDENNTWNGNSTQQM